MSTRWIKPFAIIGGSAAVTAAALAGAILQGQGTDAIAGSEMSTGVTVTVSTAPSGLPVPVAEPSIKGPAPLPSEMQGLPG